MFSVVLLGTLILVVSVYIIEAFSPSFLTEGFSNLPRTSYWSQFTAPRSDIDFEKEVDAYIRDPRFFNDYADVSRLGVSYDFCRVLAPRDEPLGQSRGATFGDKKNRFFACALTGTDRLDAVSFRTAGEKDGFRLSPDDYMRDINGDGRDDYCRILKWKDGTYQPVCARAGDLGFDSREVIDSSPPQEIQTLVNFYQDCVLWLRFFNDLEDRVSNVKVAITGGVEIDETLPKTKPTEGLQITGNEQFLRLSDAADLSLGTKIPLRSVRAWMTWVYFDEFTNNAKIFDFGNGAGRDNVFLGIIGKGDTQVEAEDLRPLLCRNQESEVLPSGKTGAQAVDELTPQEAMKQSDANVDEYVCKGFEVSPRRLPPSTITPINIKTSDTQKATLLFEIWDKQARKMRIKVSQAIPKQRWTHICVTATSMDAFRPDYAVYINGKKIYEKESGWLPAASSMTNCYIGKSNWSNAVSQYENRDEGFRGRIFDFRAYRRNVSNSFVDDCVTWGKEKLDLSEEILE